MGTAPCGAIDYQPFDFVPQVPNTLLLMNYYEFETRNELNNTITGTNKNHTGLTSQIGILRPIYYNQGFDHPYMLNSCCRMALSITTRQSGCAFGT
jgi:hypothetical protein